MAAKPTAFSGVIFDKQTREAKNVFFVGLAYDPTLTIGGGPVIPETPPEMPPPDLGIWQDPGGYNPDNPSQPLPPDKPNPPFEAKVVWTEETGWQVVLVPTGEHVTPSKKK